MQDHLEMQHDGCKEWKDVQYGETYGEEGQGTSYKTKEVGWGQISHDFVVYVKIFPLFSKGNGRPLKRSK